MQLNFVLVIFSLLASRNSFIRCKWHCLLTPISSEYYFFNTSCSLYDKNSHQHKKVVKDCHFKSTGSESDAVLQGFDLRVAQNDFLPLWQSPWSSMFHWHTAIASVRQLFYLSLLNWQNALRYTLSFNYTKKCPQLNLR